MRDLIKDIDGNKFSAIEGISSRVLKIAFRLTVGKTTSLFKKSFNQGVFPSEWKTATVVPLPKVSLLPLPGKLIEKIVLKENSVLDDRRGFFRRGHWPTNTIANLWTTFIMPLIIDN